MNIKSLFSRKSKLTEKETQILLLREDMKKKLAEIIDELPIACKHFSEIFPRTMGVALNEWYFNIDKEHLKDKLDYFIKYQVLR